MSLYDDLGVPPHATPNEIKQSFRKLSRKHHPDRDGGSHEEMAKVNAAYKVLSDPEARARYDRSGDAKLPLTLRQRAIQKLAKELINVLITQNEKLRYSNIVKGLRDGAREHIKGMRKAIGEFELSVPRIKDARDRLSGGEEILGIFDQAINEAEESILKLKDDIAVMEEVLEILKPCNYRHDPPPQDREMDPAEALERLLGIKKKAFGR